MTVRFGVFLAMVAFLCLASTNRAVAADPNEEARAYLEKAKAAFALSHYAQAAEYFEKAFELRSDRALLYNAAQSHRLAGNKERALALYQNYLRVYGNDEKAAHIEKQIEELKRAIERDRKEKAPAALTPPPAVTAPSTAATPPPEPPKPLPAAPAPAPVEPLASSAGSAAPPAAPNPADSAPSGGGAPVLTKSATPGEGEATPLTRKPWFWIAVGGGAAAAVAAVLLITMSKTNDPSPTFGSASGN